VQDQHGQRIEHASAGEANYASYFAFSDGKSLVTGAPLLPYHEQPDKLRDAWSAGAGGVIHHVTAKAPALALAAGMWDSEADDLERDEDADDGNHAQAVALRMCASQARAAIALDGVQADKLKAIILEIATALCAQMRGASEIRRAEVIDWTTRAEVEFDVYADA
jgi:hypothetical protein